MKKLLRYIVLILTMILMSSTLVFAEGACGSGEEGFGGGTGSGSIINGSSYKKSGIITYLIDENGNIVSDVKSMVCFNKYPDDSHYMYLKTRYDNVVLDRITNGSLQDSPFDFLKNGVLNSNTSGNGKKIKNALISKSGENSYYATDFIDYYWGASMKEKFLDEKLFLILEEFSWQGLYNQSTYLGDACCSSIGWISMREQYQCPEWSNGSTYILLNFPESMFYDVSVVGVPAATATGSRHTYDEIKTYGYGIIAVWAEDMGKTETEEVVNVNSDAILSNELNYIYKNFSGTRSGIKDGFEISKINMKSIAKHKSGYQWSMDNYTVSETISGDLWGFKGANALFYRTANCSDNAVWKTKSATKSFDDDAVAQPQYAFNISRALWGDNLVLCNYLGKTSNTYVSSTSAKYKNFAIDKLGFTWGNKSTANGVSAGANIDGTIEITKSDTYTFKGSTTERWKNWEQTGSHKETDENGEEKTVPDYGYVNKTASLESAEISYTVTHYLDKYKPYNYSTIEYGNAGDIAFLDRLGINSNNNINLPAVKVGFVTQSSEDLIVYPEVAMKMYYTAETDTLDGNTGEIEEVDVYVMGEYARQTKSPILHTYTASFSSGISAKGTCIVTPNSVGTRVFDLAERWEDATGDIQDNMFVINQGGNFVVATENNPKVTVVTYALDVSSSVDGENLKSDWGNSFDAKSYHNQAVQTIANDLDFKVTGRYYKIDRSIVKEYDFTQNVDMQDLEVALLDEETIDIVYKDGVIENKDDIIAKIKSYSGLDSDDAIDVYNSWGLDEILDAMFVSSTDPDNNSRNKFYDEESHALCIKVYRSKIVYPQFMFEDKVDFGDSLSQDAYDITKNGTTGVQARFYFDMFFKSDSLDFNGYTFNMTDKKYLMKDAEIIGTRFVISNMTSIDDIKW